MKVERFFATTLIASMMAVAFLLFLWGGYQYVLGATNESERETGRMRMMYGIIGLLIMVSAFSILKIAASTFGVEVPN